MKNNTGEEYSAVVQLCRDLFLKKTKDYGTAWRVLRLSSITDQIFIKAQRIRTLEEKKVSMVGEGIRPEYIGIVNYCLIAMMQYELSATEPLDLPYEKVAALFDIKAEETRQLMFAKNHDYGEAWREMRVSSLTDLILMKLLRVKQIEDNMGQTLASEGVIANYQDMMNYSIFALIRLDEDRKTGNGNGLLKNI
ncbi:DUF1599 domain-containing protein [Hufsiella ginkgonis]|uniref:DUF1599 domain-containing protein n=1 Tax=Hufsiella ginkgonis TaxID=2695274 RepID=A0A7K1Y225_9SPHI|nr:DUF1599 domain-containing protein [Hufsiella ginkgonis]MXV17128.1 DUF1599 domain-containing protein [Hufsiella ginkgonis]